MLWIISQTDAGSVKQAWPFWIKRQLILLSLKQLKTTLWNWPQICHEKISLTFYILLCVCVFFFFLNKWCMLFLYLCILQIFLFFFFHYRLTLTFTLLTAYSLWRFKEHMQLTFIVILVFYSLKTNPWQISLWDVSANQRWSLMFPWQRYANSTFDIPSKFHGLSLICCVFHELFQKAGRLNEL